MQEQFVRTEYMLGTAGFEKVRAARVAVFGLGGVGGYVVEALARSGVGALDLIDDDRVSLSNLNRQIIATHSTVGLEKTEAAKRRVLDINPEVKVTVHNTFFTPATAHLFDFSQYDYVVDAIDTVTGKLELVEQAVKAGVPIISSMGTGSKLDPTAFRVADINKTAVCPLARVMRKELRKRGIKKLKVLYSEEPAVPPMAAEGDEPGDFTPERPGKAKELTPGSVAFVPGVAGLIIGGEVIKDLAGLNNP